MSFISFVGSVILVVILVLGVAYAIECYTEDDND